MKRPFNSNAGDSSTTMSAEWPATLSIPPLPSAHVPRHHAIKMTSCNNIFPLIVGDCGLLKCLLYGGGQSRTVEELLKWIKLLATPRKSAERNTTHGVASTPHDWLR